MVLPSCIRASRWLPLFAVAAMSTVLLAGCGKADHVTYYDPNPPGAFGAAESEPVGEFGAAAFERGLAVERARADVAATIALVQLNRTDDATQQLSTFRTDSLPPVAGALGLVSPPASDRLLEITGSDDTPLPDVPMLRVIDQQLAAAGKQIIPVSAADDSTWRAALLDRVIEEGSGAYEQAFVGEEEVALRTEYARAWGLIQAARTRLVTSLSADRSGNLPNQISTFAQRFVPTVVPPEQARSGEAASNEAASIMDELEQSYGFATTGSEPKPDSEQHIARALQDAEALRDALAGTSTVEQQRHLLHAAQRSFEACASDISTVDPSIVGRVEFALGVTIRRHLDHAGTEDIETAAGSVVSDITQARVSVKDELAALEEDA